MANDFDFRLKIHKDGNTTPIWSYHLFEKLSQARDSALDCISVHPKVEIYAIGRGLNYGKEFVVETHVKKELEVINRGIAFESDPDKWGNMVFELKEETCR